MASPFPRSRVKCAFFALLSSLAIPCGLARADGESADVRAALEQGAFIEAAQLGEIAGDTQSLTLAARARLAESLTAPGAPVGQLIAQAEVDARRALVLDRTSVEARVYLALALGVKGRRASLMEAARRGYAREGYALLQEALARAPEHPVAHALLGAWHFEVVRRGGSAGAAFYGASVAQGVSEFEKALALAPASAEINYQYAVALLERDPVRNVAQAQRLLETATGCAAGDALTRRVQLNAARVLAVLRESGARAAAAEATAYLG